jgi:hypothetical protein
LGIGGGVGMLYIKPVRFELIYGAKPYHAIPFPVPQSLEAATKTETRRGIEYDITGTVNVIVAVQHSTVYYK